MNVQADPTQRWIGRPTQRPEARLRLFCLPYAGGSSAVYRPWASLLPREIELCLVQLPGRETRLRETPYTSMGALVADLALAMSPLLDRPFAIFGHSMGALVGLELARYLRAAGLPTPDHLFVSGRRAPQNPELDPPMHQLSDAQFIVTLARRYGGIPQAVLQDVELLRLFLPALRADMTMVETYRATDDLALEHPITAFGGLEDNRAGQVDLVGWRSHTRGAFAVRMFPGGHFFLQPARASVVEAITAALTNAGAAPTRQHATVTEPSSSVRARVGEAL